VLSAQEVVLFHAERERLRSIFQGVISIEGHLITENVPVELLDHVSCNAATKAMTIAADGSMFPCEIMGAFAVVPNIRHTAPAQAWMEHATFNQFRHVKTVLRGGCGTVGCPGSAMAPAKLVAIAR
jgi:radical SAM protein with 4Fe4S-binding SPASM domain